MNDSIKAFEQKIIQSINEAQLPVEVIRLVLENTLYKVITAQPPEPGEGVNEDAEST